MKLQPSGELQIVHVTTERVRLRTTDSSLNSMLDSIAQDRAYARRLERIVKTDTR
ncbi:hypothetical protein LC609_34080 [Nostoc sp. XA013]|nr:hypothetical protein [Nostoc sp. XA013]